MGKTQCEIPKDKIVDLSHINVFFFPQNPEAL